MIEQQIYQIDSAAAMRDLGRMLAAQMNPGDLITLQGPLGAGKTTLVQGLAAGLGVVEDANSPTFVLIVEHEGRLPLLHLDAYRLESRCYDAIRDAGVLDMLDREDGIKVVEWPERIADFLPRPRFAISIEFADDPAVRRVELVGNKVGERLT